MTTPVEGNDLARPDSGPATAVEPQAAQPAPSAPTDPDEIELQQALAAVQTEEAASKAAAPEIAAKVDQPAPPQPEPPKEGQPQQRAKVVPRQRFDAVVDRAQKAEQAAAYYKGIADARAAPPQPAGQGQPQKPAPTPEQKLAQVHAYVDGLAKKFDAGEISMADFKREERRAQQHEHKIREDMLAAKLKPAQQPAEPGKKDQSLYLETLTAQLEKAHPWVELFDTYGNDADWQYLKAQAVANLTERGIDARNGDLGSYELRREMAALTDHLGPALIGPRVPRAQQGIPAGQPQTKPLSPQAQARQAKLDMAASAPPNLANLAGSTGAPGYSLEQIAGLSEADYDKLPKGVRDKYLGLSA